MKEAFFEEVEANSKVSESLSSFLEGGYYAVDISGVLVISLNSMYPFYKNDVLGPSMTATMFEWLSSTLKENQQNHPERKFIIMSHIWVGLDYYRTMNSLWNESYIEDYLDILKEYESQHLLTIGAHVHVVRV
jgi:hypothetical protein